MGLNTLNSRMKNKRKTIKFKIFKLALKGFFIIIFTALIEFSDEMWTNLTSGNLFAKFDGRMNDSSNS